MAEPFAILAGPKRAREVGWTPNFLSFGSDDLEIFSLGYQNQHGSLSKYLSVIAHPV